MNIDWSSIFGGAGNYLSKGENLANIGKVASGVEIGRASCRERVYAPV